MTPRFNIFLLFAILTLGIPYYWLFVDNGPPDVTPKPVTLAALRLLAAEKPGSSPVSIAVERVTHSTRQSNWLAAGTGIVERPYATMSFRLDVPGSEPVLIDTGADRRRLGSVALEGFDPAAQKSVDHAMREAGLILLTGARIEQLGGLAALGDAAVAQKAMLNDNQVRWVHDGPGYDWPVRISIAPRITGSAPVPVAPGIVVIPTGTPEPHNQMIFVRLADGREYLFAGQVAPTASAWLRQRGRPRLRTDHYLPEDRQEALAWLHTIRQLRRNDPGLRIIPGVDFAAAAGPRSGTGITVGFPGRAEPPQVAGKP